MSFWYVCYYSLWLVLVTNEFLICKLLFLKGVDREKSAVFKELTQSFRTYELRGQARKKKKKKALTESKTNKYLTLSYKNISKKPHLPLKVGLSYKCKLLFLKVGLSYKWVFDMYVIIP